MDEKEIIDPPVDLETLEFALKAHRRELKLIKKMNEAQFVAFKKNFSVGHLPEITKGEAMALLSNMIGTNLRMKELLEKDIII